MNWKHGLLMPIFAVLMGTGLPASLVHASVSDDLKPPTNLSAKADCNKLLHTVPKRETFLNPRLIEKTPGHAAVQLTQQKGWLARLTNFAANAILHPAFSLKKMERSALALRSLLEDPNERDVPYYQKVVRAFRLTPKFNEDFLDLIPKIGPLIVTMNHPLSGLELLAVAATVQRVRPDVKVVSSKFLEAMPGLTDHAILVDNMGGDAAKQYNIERREMIIESLRRGEVIVISPAGALSIKENPTDKVALDPPWKLGVAEFIDKVPSAQVLPVFVEGTASQAFHRAKAMHPFAGTAMILREISEGSGSEIDFSIGTPISSETLAKFTSRRELVSYLRARTYMMADSRTGTSLKGTQVRKRSEDYAAPMPDEVIADELGRQRVLYDMAPANAEKGMMTFMAFGRDIPNVLQELGRLREITFWKANEGTGRARDLDVYDANYIHLVAWDKKLKKIAGAYRIGLTDKIVAELGFKATYISNYFDVEPYLDSFLSQLVEVGRSFVVPEYQGRSLAFPALIGALARFIAWHPQYHGFFGAVSVSNDYKEISKALILRWAETHEGAREFGRVLANNPPQLNTNLSAAELDLLVKHAVSFQDLNDLIKNSEGDVKVTAPQLIKVYKKLGTKFLAFDKDVEFNTIDGLIFQSILNFTPEQRLETMGAEGTANFEAYWEKRLRDGPPPIIPAE